MRILLVQSKPCYPKVDGGTVASAHLLESLKKDHEVQVLFRYSHKHPFIPQEWKSVDHIPVKADLRIRPFDALKALIRNKSYHLSRFEGVELQQKVKESMASSFDLVIFDGLFSMAEFETYRKFHQGPIVLRPHNVEHKIWEDKAQQSAGIKKLYFKILSTQLLKLELRFAQVLSLILPLTELDAQWFEKHNSQVETLPFFPTLGSIPNECHPNTVVHFAAMNWMPNQQSLKTVLEDIFPRIKQQCPDVRLEVRGSYMEEIQQLPQEGVDWLGKVKDLERFWQNCGVLLVAPKEGSGVRIKVLEALAHGVALVSTSKGVEGLPSNLQKAVLVFDKPTDFAYAAAELLSDNSKRKIYQQRLREEYQAALQLKDLNDIFAKYGL